MRFLSEIILILCNSSIKQVVYHKVVVYMQVLGAVSITREVWWIAVVCGLPVVCFGGA